MGRFGFGETMSSEVAPFTIQKAMMGEVGDDLILTMIGDDVELLDSSERSPLFHAVRSGRVELVAKLLEMGATTTRHDLEGRTPLHFAILERNVPIAKLLLDAGAEVDAKDEHGNTPLWGAVMRFRNFEDMIKLLCSFGASPESKNIYHKSPMDLAKSLKVGDAAEWLERYSS